MITFHFEENPNTLLYIDPIGRITEYEKEYDWLIPDKGRKYLADYGIKGLVHYAKHFGIHPKKENDEWVFESPSDGLSMQIKKQKVRMIPGFPYCQIEEVMQLTSLFEKKLLFVPVYDEMEVSSKLLERIALTILESK